MSDVEWKEVPFYKFDPNVPVTVSFEFPEPVTDIKGPPGKRDKTWWYWGVWVDDEPFKIKSGMTSSLLTLLRQGNYGKGETAEIVLKQSGNSRWYEVDGKKLESEVKKPDDRKTESKPGNGSPDRFDTLMKSLTELHLKIDTMIDNLAVVTEYLSDSGYGESLKETPPREPGVDDEAEDPDKDLPF